jgi:regulator of replication initiation timing
VFCACAGEELDGVHVRNAQDQVRELEQENVALRLEVGQLREKMQKAHDDAKKEVCCVCLLHLQWTRACTM